MAVSGLKLIDKMPDFSKNVEAGADFALSYIAAQIERLSKMRVPQKTSVLQNSGFHKKTGKLQYSIVYGGRAEPYAYFQHEGQRKDGTHVVRKYSSPGTGKHFLKGAADDVVRGAQKEITELLGRVQP